MKTRNTSLMLALVLASGAIGAPRALAQPEPRQIARATATAERVLVNKSADGLALQGYDPVAYFTVAKPTKGSDDYTATYQSATYRFVSAANRDAFKAEPARYAPQFGGYCAYAASINKLSPISPDQWEIIDGRLVLQHNKRATDAWKKDPPGNLIKADANWPGLVAKNGANVSKTLVNVDGDGVAIMGYDPVAYFTISAPTKGDPSIAAIYNGATYHFANAEHKEMFEREPAKYAPQFGGYCAYAASINKLSPIDPQFWSIENDRLLLQHTKKAYDLFYDDPQKSLANADRNWPGLVAKRGK
jgi:YHS domain-containing protein